MANIFRSVKINIIKEFIDKPIIRKRNKLKRKKEKENIKTT